MASTPPKQFTTIEEYIASQTSQVQTILKKLKKVIKKAAPDAEETISYQMPAFKFHGLLLWFAAAKNHYAIYPKADVIEVFKDKLKPYGISKGTIRFPYNKPLPEALITEIIEYRVKANLSKALQMNVAEKKKSTK
jgi:uncharacterized protein YdhG (YjbR/CyaY superfamily)